jgi:hypothetical protein
VTDAGIAFVGQGYDSASEVGAVTLVARAGGLHELNPSAALVWRQWREPASPAAVTAALADTLAVDAATLAADVMAAAGGLLAAGLLEPVGVPPVRAILEPVPACSGCGPGPTYECHVLVALGDVAVAVGADAELADALARGFGARTLDVRPAEGRASYGLVVPHRSPGPRHELARLHRGPDVLARVRDPWRAVRALIDQIGAHAVPAGALVLDAVAVESGGRVALVPVPRDRKRYERSCRDTGIRASDGVVVTVDVASREVVIGSPWLGFDEAAVASVVEARRWVEDTAAVPPAGRYQLVGFGVTESPGLGRVIGELGPSIGSGLADASVSLLGLVEALGVTGSTDPTVVLTLPAPPR